MEYNKFNANNIAFDTNQYRDLYLNNEEIEETEQIQEKIFNYNELNEQNGTTEIINNSSISCYTDCEKADIDDKSIMKFDIIIIYKNIKHNS